MTPQSHPHDPAPATGPTLIRTRSPGGRRWAATLAGIALALGALELVVRQVYRVQTQIHPVLGLIFQPGTQVRWRREGDGTSHWTVLGLRGTSPPDLTNGSILALGDSYTEGLMVDDGEVFTQRLQERLPVGVNVPVVNAGRSSTSVADHVALSGWYKQNLRPRWTVVQLRDDDLTDDAWNKGKVHFVTDGMNLRTVVPPAPVHGRLWSALWPWRQRSAAFGYSFVRLGEFRQGFAAEPPMFRAGSVPSAGTSVRPPDPGTYPVAAELDLLHRAYDGHLILLYLPAFDLRNPHEARSGLERTIEDWCRNRGVTLVNLRSAYAGMARQGLSPFGFTNTAYNQGHLNAVGHNAAADLLAPVFARLAAHGLL